jgi:transcriptional regulator with XRE-family HTH domain
MRLNQTVDRVKEDDVGGVVRALRKRQKLTLDELSRRSGLPISSLSRIETGKMQLSYDKLLRISAGLDVDMAALLGDGANARDPVASQALGGRRAIDLHAGGREIETAQYTCTYRASSLLNKRFVPVTVEPKARTLEEFGPLVEHGGEEFVLVIEGQVEVHTAAYAPVLLSAGDSIYIDSRMGHAYLNGGSAPCRLAVICAGEAFDAEEGFDVRIDDLAEHRARKKAARGA